MKKHRIIPALCILLLLMAAVLSGCGDQEVQPADTTQTAATESVLQTEVESDPSDNIYFNLDKFLEGTPNRQKSRETGLYTIRFLVNGSLIEMQTDKAEVVEQLDRFIAVVPSSIKEGMLRGVKTAQSSLGGSFYDSLEVTAVDAQQMSVTLREAPLVYAENCKVFDMTGQNGQYGCTGQVRAGDRIACYADADGIVKQIFVLERNEPHDDGHVCAHCGNAVTWTQWDGTAAMTSGHYSLADDVSTETITLSGVDVTLCLNGHSLTSLDRVFELQDNAVLNITDHETWTGTYLGSVAGGGIVYTGEENQEMVGGTFYVADGSKLALYGGELTVNIPTDYSRAVKKGGVIYTEGTFELHGGILTGGQVKYRGGALYVGPNGIFEMSGGLLRYGEAVLSDDIEGSGYGGTAYIASNSTYAEISGGKLIAGIAGYGGGGICTAKDMVISGGEFTGDKTEVDNAKYGGVLMVMGGAEVTVKSGTVFHSGSAGEGGNLSCRHKGTLTLEAGVLVRDGYARNGGNIANFGTLNIDGAEIWDGYAVNSGGNIYSFTNGTTNVNLYSGLITGGSAALGGNISMYGDLKYEVGSILNVYGGTISNGVARNGQGGNVDLRRHSAMNMTGGLITGGSASDKGGGVAGTYTQDGDLYTHISLGGSAQIIGNEGSDLFLRLHTFAEVMPDTPFTEEAKIGIDAENPYTTLVLNATEDCVSVFTCTQEGLQITYENGELKTIPG